MPISIMDVVNSLYRTTKEADVQCARFLHRLGHTVRYLPARLAIARSLSLSTAPTIIVDDEDEMTTPIRGQQLFGDGNDPSAWVALIIQRSGNANISRREFQKLVGAHWRRGAELLTKDWEQCGEEFEPFVARLAELANLSDEHQSDAIADVIINLPQAIAGDFTIPVGPTAEDAQTGDSVMFSINAQGGSPHIAIMGGTNSGKTYTATTMVRSLKSICDVPMLAFDFKGDLTNLAKNIGANVIEPPRSAVPLDVLSVQRNDDVGVREAAGRIRDSIGRVKSSRLGGVQSDTLRRALLQTLTPRKDGRPAYLSDVARALENEYQNDNRRPDELIATMNEITQFALFEPRLSPAVFFAQNWIIRLPQDSTQEVRRMVINLTLDALDRWLNSQEDTPEIQGRRGIRHLCLLDEAHVILSVKLPALTNLVRLSRSKGGVVMLVSQSPDDFESSEEGFLDNMGLILAFNTQAKAGPTQRIFGRTISLSNLPVGEALCRIRTETSTRRVRAWTPEM